MKLISWNIAGKVKECAHQVDALGERCPDIVALQDVRGKALPVLADKLAGLGLGFIQSTREIADRANRVYAVLVASRWPFCPKIFEIPPSEFSERILAVQINTPIGPLVCFTTHIPPGSQYGMLKIRVFEWLYSQLARPSAIPRILCGDFNSPKAEQPGGTVITWGQTIRKNGSPALKKGFETWDAGERNVLTGLAYYDLLEIFRLLNGWSIQESSWERQIWSHTHGYRFDHVFTSRSLNPITCQYLHAFRQAGLSDHSPIEVDFKPDDFFHQESSATTISAD